MGSLGREGVLVFLFGLVFSGACGPHPRGLFVLGLGGSARPSADHMDTEVVGSSDLSSGSGLPMQTGYARDPGESVYELFDGYWAVETFETHPGIPRSRGNMSACSWLSKCCVTHGEFIVPQICGWV
jgi:hypothetical protein